MSKLLLVDDDVELTELLSSLLTLEGFDVQTANNGSEALQKLDESHELVLLDVMMPKLNEYYIGQLFYFFEKAVGMSGYMIEVNPFNQPGVEAYKGNMFALLEKPGYEEQTKAIKSRL